VSSDTEKRHADQSADDVQRGNREWWSKNPMSYDWHGEMSAPPLSLAWFDAIDARFLAGAHLFATAERPFDRIMPLDDLAGKRVLEIGCGMGLHSETMARAGARVTAIDVTPTAVAATKRRLELKGLEAEVLEVDAETLPFPNQSFDFVWSWGVIHHSARTGRIVRQIARVLRASGECRIMVYNRDGMAARAFFLRDHLLKAKFMRQSFDETLWETTDGFSARYYVRDQFEDLFRTFFSDVSSEICGQEADAIPLPRRVRALAARFLPERYLREAQARRGSFIFLRAREPLGGP